MEDTVVTLRFTDLGRARRALHELERLDHERRLHVRGATLVQRSGQGGIDAPRAARDDEGHYLPPGGSLLRAAWDEAAACIGVGHRPSASGQADTAHALVHAADRPVLVVPETP